MKSKYKVGDRIVCLFTEEDEHLDDDDCPIFEDGVTFRILGFDGNCYTIDNDNDDLENVLDLRSGWSQKWIEDGTKFMLEKVVSWKKRLGKC